MGFKNKLNDAAFVSEKGRLTPPTGCNSGNYRSWAKTNPKQHNSINKHPRQASYANLFEILFPNKAKPDA
jgi:hypothetical protein